MTLKKAHPGILIKEGLEQRSKFLNPGGLSYSFDEKKYILNLEINGDSKNLDLEYFLTPPRPIETAPKHTPIIVRTFDSIEPQKAIFDGMRFYYLDEKENFALTDSGKVEILNPYGWINI
jgi:hypothetical protein